MAQHIDSKTPKPDREQILTDFKTKKIQVICNVEIITEGFDFPECEVVQLARPTKSLALYLQMVGRVMRPAKNKLEGIILDKPDNVYQLVINGLIQLQIFQFQLVQVLELNIALFQMLI